MAEWRSPGVLVGGAAILASIALFFADKLVPDKDLAERLRDALNVAGDAAPWVIAVGTFLIAVDIIRRLSRSASTLEMKQDALQNRQREAEEQTHKLEAQIAELNKRLMAATAPPQKPAPAQPPKPPASPRHQWASTLEGIVHVAVPNSELEAMYQRATAILTEINADGWLDWFAVYVSPYGDLPDEVRITLSFHSERSRRDYYFSLSDDGHFSPDRSGMRTIKPSPRFADLPWRQQPKWCDMFNLAARLAGPLVRDSDTEVMIGVGSWGSSLEWSITVKDFGGGRQLEFRGSSPSDVRQW